MNIRSITTCLALALFVAVPALEAQGLTSPMVPTVKPLTVNPAPATAPRPVDLALCLDTSGSMSGLINAARTRLWNVVNDLALAKPTPRLRVALITFGNTRNPNHRGWVKVETGFTEDLDQVSKILFALTTSGGTELVGRTIQTALSDLAWTPGHDSLKLLFVCGNESADQDREVPFRDQVRAAIARGIMVNSIYCGNGGDRIAPAWREVARLADGQFAALDHNHVAKAVATPFDGKIAALSSKVNQTYIPLGPKGKVAAENQEAQDRNAVTAGGGVAQSRAASKAGRLYRCKWDLVDASGDGTVKLEEVEKAQLPKALQKLAPAELKAHVEKKRAQRGAIQKEIQELDRQRRDWIADHQAKNAEAAGKKSLDRIVQTAIREQAKKRGFEFAPQAKPEAPKPPATEKTPKAPQAPAVNQGG